MFWLSGPAGAGKSAIVQTIAERCDQRKVPHANFFFFRADNSRSNASPLVATLSYQIIQLYPSIRNSVADLLSDNPLIFRSTLENQVVQLIVTPLRTIQQSSRKYCPLLLLIDGLDECNSENKRSQQQILRAFDSALKEHSDLMRLLVASRDESQIQAAFNKISSQCLHLYLDDQYSPENDIRVFVDAQFEQVRKTHPLAHTLNATWPSATDINFIVEKSLGQFVYAATVMRFISDSAASPKLSLERVQGAARRATKSPFAQLDAIYLYILSQADDQELVKDILRAQLLITKIWQGRPVNKPPKRIFMMLLERCNSEYTEDVVLSCLAELTPIVKYKDEILLFHHASFSDYLLDQSRSEEYFVDFAAISFKILPIIWKLLANGSNHKNTCM
jgi:DnaJ-domain-containing protein 1